MNSPSNRSRTTFALAIAGLFALPPATAVAATINVVNGGCTLADAITAANTDRRTGACSAGAGADSIALPASGTQTLRAVLPDIASAITILGNGGSVIRDAAAPLFRIFTVLAAADLTLRDTTVSGGMVELFDGGYYSGGGISNEGRLTVLNCTVSGNSAAYGYGGGINNQGTATVADSTITGNRASGGGGISNSGDAATLVLTNSLVSNNRGTTSGGGMFNFAGTTTVEGSTITDNAGGDGGGGIDSSSGTFVLRNSTVSNNDLFRYGGGGISHYGTLIVSGSTISGNDAGIYSSGGGILSKGSLTLSNSTVSGNTAERGGGVAVDYDATLSDCLVSGNRALAYEGYEGGGGLGDGAGVLSAGRVSMRNCTVSGNSADNVGGGVLVRGFAGTESYLDLIDSTLSGNRSKSGGGAYAGSYSVLSFARSLVAGNAATGSGAEIRARGTGNTVRANARNLFGHDGLSNTQAFAGFTPGASDLTATRNGNTRTALTDILDTTLSDNGGPTLTHALVTGSPAVDAAGSECSATDQRGVTRPQGAGCDIGAFELEGSPGGVPRIEFSRLGETVSESSGVRRIALRLSEPSADEVTVRIDYDGSAKRGADYTARSTVSIPAGQTQFSFPLRVLDDGLDEPTEQIGLTLRAPIGAVLGSDKARTLRISDNDPRPTVQFQQGASDIQESAGTQNLSLRLSAASGRTVTVPVSYGGSARRNVDYSGPDSVRIAAGQIEVNLAVRIIDDTIREGQETIVLDLGVPTHADRGSRARHIIRIAAGS